MDKNNERPQPDPFLAWIDSIYEAPPGWDTSAVCRRLSLVLADLGLADLVGNDWGSPAAGSVNFRSVTLRQAGALVKRLEDISRLLPQRPNSSGGPGQLFLFSGFHDTTHRHGGRVRT